MNMNTTQFVAVCNVLIATVFLLCVVKLAMYFNSTALCWWFLLTPFLCMGHKDKSGGDSDAT